MEMTPNMRRVLKAAYLKAPNGEVFVLDELNLAVMDERAKSEAADLLSFSGDHERSFEHVVGQQYQNTPLPYKVTTRGRERGRQIVEEDDAAERQRMAVEKAARRARFFKWGGWVFAFFQLVITAFIAPLVVNHYDRRIQKLEERLDKQEAAQKPTTSR